VEILGEYEEVCMVALAHTQGRLFSVAQAQLNLVSARESEEFRLRFVVTVAGTRPNVDMIPRQRGEPPDNRGLLPVRMREEWQ